MVPRVGPEDGGIVGAGPQRPAPHRPSPPAVPRNASSPRPALASGVFATAIALGGWGGHSCAIVSGGGVKCWGGNSHGQLGVGSMGWGSQSTSPVDVPGARGGG